MYTPSHAPGLVVEHLFDETLVLVSSRPDDQGPGEDYIYIEWGPGFYAQHAQACWCSMRLAIGIPNP